MSDQSEQHSVLFSEKSRLDNHLDYVHQFHLKLTPFILAIQVTHTLICVVLQAWLLAAVFGLGLIHQMATMRRNQIKPDQPSRWLLAIWVILLVQSLLAVGLVGTKLGFHFYLIATIPAAFASTHQPLRFKVFQTAVIACFFLICVIWLDDVAPFYSLDKTMVNVLMPLNLLGVFVLLAAVSHTQAQLLNEAEDALRQIASTDALTGLFNRRSFTELIQRETARSQRSGRPLTLCLCDIDFFKRVNDTYGHAAGDHVLKTLSDLLRTALRDGDFVARWGGEEFVILWPETDALVAQQISERLREMVAACHISFEGKVIPVSLTLGIAQFSGDEKWPAVVARADEALYRGKAEGRNRVVLG